MLVVELGRLAGFELALAALWVPGGSVDLRLSPHALSAIVASASTESGIRHEDNALLAPEMRGRSAPARLHRCGGTELRNSSVSPFVGDDHVRRAVDGESSPIET
jgi:hypothetical protein